MTDWYAIEEKLPPPYKRVLIFNRKTKEELAAWHDPERNVWIRDDGSWTPFDEISHWKELEA